MRPDQIARLRDIEERMLDVFMAEADPNEWPGGTTPSAQLEVEERKQRYLWKRAAAETAQLLVRTRALIEERPEDGGAAMPSLEKRIEAREKEAQQLLERTISRARGAVADGKPGR